MKVLLTNDDGYRAEGLWALARPLAERCEVVIVAPDRQRSAISHAITLHKPLRLKRMGKMEGPNVRVYATNGTPADAVMLGLLEVAPDTDVVVSGINGGPNMGEDVMYSGTVAAAVEGALLGKRSIAVSLSEYNRPVYGLAAKFTAGLAEELAEAGVPGNTVLNVNVPPGGEEEYRGYEITPLGTRKYEDILEKRVDPRGETYYWVMGQLVRNASVAPSDIHTINEGKISITPLSLNGTNWEMVKRLRFQDPPGRRGGARD